MGCSFRLTARVFYMHHPTDRIAHTTAFVTPVVGHWLEREIAQWVHHEGSIRRPIVPWANVLTTELHLAPVKKWDAEFDPGRDSLEDDPSQRTSVTGDHGQDSWRHHGRQTSNRVLHCHWVEISPRTASMQSSTTSFICPKCQYSVPKLLGSDLKQTRHFLDRSQQLSSEICDYVWVRSPSLATRDKATVNTVETGTYVLHLLRMPRLGCLQARWWAPFSVMQKEGREEMFYLTMHSTHFIYGYMVKDHSDIGKETCCRHIGYSFRLAARVLLYAPSHRQDSTYHDLCYTSCGATGWNEK